MRQLASYQAGVLDASRELGIQPPNGVSEESSDRPDEDKGQLDKHEYLRGQVAGIMIYLTTKAAPVRQFKCACGWEGPADHLMSNLSGVNTCPECCSSGGLVLDEEAEAVPVHQFKCACGWKGPTNKLVSNSSDINTCPECGGSGGLVLDEEREAV